jgi:hypothetical protein
MTSWARVSNGASSSHAWSRRAQQIHVQAAIALALRREPTRELWIAVDLDAIEHIAAEAIAELAELRRRDAVEPRTCGALDVDHVDARVSEIEADLIVRRDDSPALMIEQAA